MKLSRALLIVLVLHVVAVAGIIAFNAIKTRQGGLPPPPLAKTANVKTERCLAHEVRAGNSETDRVREARRRTTPSTSVVAKEEPKDRPGEARAEAIRMADVGQNLHRRERRQPGHDRAEIQGLVRRSAGG